ncbi:MAG: hypothetical protein NVSMB47_11030 [Polyangiales bacterium]
MTLALALSTTALLGCSSSDFQVAAPPGDDAGDVDSAAGGDTSVVDTGGRVDGTSGDVVASDVSGKPDAPAPDGPLPPVDAPPGAEATCAALAEAFCTRFEGCAATALAVYFGGGAECRERRKKDCLAGVGAPGSHENNLARTNCAAGWGAISCEDLTNGATPPGCIPGPGDVPVGGPCAFDAQCADGVCDLAAGALCGTCASGAVGSACKTHCLPALTCAPDNHCRIPKRTDESCDPVNAPCVPLDACVGGQCKPLGAAAGVDCDPANVDAPSCAFVLGLYCPKPIAGKSSCTAYTLASVGDHCGPIPASPFAVCRGSVCKPNPDGTFSCVSEIDEGAACDGASYAICKPYAKCVGGTCSLPAPLSCK